MRITIDGPVFVSAPIFQKRWMVILLYIGNISSEGFRLFEVCIRCMAKHGDGSIAAHITVFVSMIDARRGNVAASQVAWKSYKLVLCIARPEHKNKVASLGLQCGIELHGKHGFCIVF